MMTLDWQPYEAFDWQRAKQAPLAADQRAHIERFAADVLGHSTSDRAEMWGAASPPGRFAATVIRVHPEVQHRFAAQMKAEQITAIAVKVFKTNRDAARETRRLITFHNHERDKLPGLPHVHLQSVLGAGSQNDPAGESRGYVVQEWIVGIPLDEVLRDSRRTPISVATAKSIIHQLLAVLTAPLWTVGTLWWDFRDANFCYDRTSDKLTMIDVDSLAAYAEEILQHPTDWTRREKGRVTALARLRQMTLRIARAACSTGRNPVESHLRRLWQAEIEPAFSQLGHSGTAVETDVKVRGFLEQLFAENSP